MTAARKVTMLGAHQGIGGNESNTLRPSTEKSDAIKQEVIAFIEEKLTPELLRALEDPQKLGVLTFELGKGFENVTKWFVK